MTRRAKILLLVGCLLSAVAHFRWFTGFGILAHGDWQVQLSESAVRSFDWPHIWGAFGLGGINVHAPFFLMHFVHGGLASLGLSFGAVERIEYLWPIAVFSYASIFFLIRRVTKSDIGAFAGSFTYAFCVYFYVIQMQHIYIMLSAALAPFAVLAYINAIERRGIKEIILAGLALYLVSATDFRIFYILALAFFFYVLAHLITERDFVSLRRIVRAGFAAGAPFAIALLLNAFWIIGFASTTTLTSNELLNRPIFGGSVPLTRVLNLHAGAWTGGEVEWFGKNPLPWWFWAYPIAAVAGFWLARKRRYATLFLFFALFAMFFGKQTGLPFGGVYEWMYENFPGFNAFREASKFKFLVIMSYSVLIGFLAAWLWKGRKDTGKKKYYFYGALIFLVLLPLSNAKPLLTGEIGGLFAEKEMHGDYRLFNDHLRSQGDDFFRVLWIPRLDTWSLAKYHPRLSTGHFSSTEVGQAVLSDNQREKAPKELLLTNLVVSKYGDALLDLMSVRYVAIPVQEDSSSDVFAPFHIEREEVIRDLYSASYLHRPTLGLTSLIVFENENYRPRVYLSAEPDNDTTYGQEVQIVQYERFSSTEYRLSLNDVSGKIYVNFVENFHPDWKLYFEKFDWRQRFIGPRNEVSGVEHSKSWIGTNLYIIDVEQLCASGQCQENESGAYDFDLTLYFSPQKYFYVGTVVSLATLFACIAGLAYIWTRSRKQRTE